MKKAMFTVEVLISIFILFLVVTLSATSSKFLNQVLRQQDRYKELYSIVFSIKDQISQKICTEQNRIHGQISGIKYFAQCTLIKEKRGFEKDYNLEEGKEIIGYTGAYLFRIYQVELEILKHNYKTTYHVTRFQRKTNF